MSNVLSKEEKQQVIALGKAGWPERRIEQCHALGSAAIHVWSQQINLESRRGVYAHKAKLSR